MFAGVLGMIALIMASTMINVAVPQIMGAHGLGQDRIGCPRVFSPR